MVRLRQPAGHRGCQISCACCTHQHRIYPSAPLSPPPSPCHLREIARPCSTSYLAHRRCPRPLAQSHAVRRQPSGLGFPLLGWSPLSRPCSVVEQFSSRHSCSVPRSICLFLVALHRICSGLAWRLTINPTSKLLPSPTGRNHLPVTPNAHEDVYDLTNLPGRDLSQPLCAGCVS